MAAPFFPLCFEAPRSDVQRDILDPAAVAPDEKVLKNA
jgi:hypothetical protein